MNTIRALFLQNQGSFFWFFFSIFTKGQGRPPLAALVALLILALYLVQKEQLKNK